MAMELREYFRFRCTEMLVMERDFWQINTLFSQEAHNGDLKELLARHSEPTRRQISNLEQIVDRLGGMLGPEENPVTQGLLRAHRDFMALGPSPDMLDLHIAMTADKAEHLEMTTYQNLLTLATQLEEQELLPLLEENRDGETRMCAALEEWVAQRFGQAQGDQRKAA